MLPLLAGYLVAVSTISNPDNPVAVVLSLFPLTAPVEMPIRIQLGDVPVWQVGASVAICLAFIWVTIVVAGRVYAGGLLRTGSRVKVRDALARRRRPPRALNRDRARRWPDPIGRGRRATGSTGGRDTGPERAAGALVGDYRSAGIRTVSMIWTVPLPTSTLPQTTADGAVDLDGVTGLGDLDVRRALDGLLGAGIGELLASGSSPAIDVVGEDLGQGAGRIGQDAVEGVARGSWRRRRWSGRRW